MSTVSPGSSIGSLLAALMVLGCAGSQLTGCVAQVRVAGPPPPAVAVRIAVEPPVLPEYPQPACPGDGFLWTPGYWAWAQAGYYWVPGTWVQPPRVGLLWTPGYWGVVGGSYAWHAGYWGPHVGFYGGVHYGFGYTGVGFAGGRWVGNSFSYNRSVTNINVVNVHNTYNETVINNVTVNKVSYNGGPAGTAATPTAQERVATQEAHVAPTAMQQQHVQEAARNPALFAKANGGRPAIAATTRPASFSGEGVVGARGAPNARPAALENSGRGNGFAPRDHTERTENGTAHPPQAGSAETPNAAHPAPQREQVAQNSKPRKDNTHANPAAGKKKAQQNKTARKQGKEKKDEHERQ